MSIASAVGDAWKEATKAEKARPPMIERTYTYASGWKPCKRAMCLDLTYPEDTVFEGQTLERFRDGDVYEEAAVVHLAKAGKHSDPPFRVEGQQERFVLKDRKDRPAIVGKIDGKLATQGQRDRVPFEIKSGTSVQNAASVDDLLRGRWTKAVPRQMAAYLFGLGLPRGVLILNRPGFPRIIDFFLDDRGLELAEDFLSRATVAVAVKHGEQDLPPFHADPGVCLRCDHLGKSCAPPIETGEGLQLINDMALEDSAREVIEKKSAAQTYKSAREHLRTSLRGRPLVLIGGRYVISGSWRRRGDNPEGSWNMEVEKMPSLPGPSSLERVLRDSLDQLQGEPK